MRRYFAASALLPQGWARNVLIEVAQNGALGGITPGFDSHRAVPPVRRLRGPLIPGMPNTHSQAYLRGLSGLMERVAPPGAPEDVVAWRAACHRFATRLTPAALEAIATQLYVEMLKGGYTAVAEFHMLHHQPDGEPYEDLAEMARRIVAASQRAGIGLTLLPVLYAQQDHKARALGPDEKRFGNDLERFLRLVGEVHRACEDRHAVRVGIAPHSLYAVPQEMLLEGVLHLTQEDSAAPVHILTAEHRRDVEACHAWSGKRPVRWLLDNAAIGPRWCLIHATQLDESELTGLVERGAVVGLSPTTEASLGAGLFPSMAYQRAGGRWGVASASQIAVDAAQELRLLEYGQRLSRRRRAALVPEAGVSGVGTYLYQSALLGGAQALAQPVGRIEAGRRADLVVLDGDHPTLFDKVGDTLMDSYVFAAHGVKVLDVMVAGEWLVEAGRHVEEDRILRRFRETAWRLAAEEGA